MKRDDVKVATPCTLDWTKMKPTQGGRFCGDCKKVVRDLSKMSELEARDLLAAQRRGEGEGELCVRFLYDKHGRVFFRDTQRAQENVLLPANLLSRARRAAAAVAIAAAPLATTACDAMDDPLGIGSPTISKDHDEPREMMGGVSIGDLPRQADPSPDVDAAAKTDAAPDGGPANEGDASEPTGVVIY